MRSQLLKSLKRPRRAGPVARSARGLVVRAALGDDVLRMLSHEPGAREFRPEDVHQMRTSVRRLRSDLRFFGPILAESETRPLREELRWLAGVLGAVRDLDVLEHRLREAVVHLDLVAASDPIFEEIDRRREARRSDLASALDGERYAALRSAAIAESRAPSLADRPGRPAGPWLVDRLGGDWRRFLRELEATPPEAPIEEIHEFRKRAKRTRYAAESATEWLAGPAGQAARQIGRQAKLVQETLGISQDAHVATDFIRDLMPGLPDAGPAREAAARLIDQQAVDAAGALDQYRSLRDRILND